MIEIVIKPKRWTKEGVSGFMVLLHFPTPGLLVRGDVTNKSILCEFSLSKDDQWG